VLHCLFPADAPRSPEAGTAPACSVLADRGRLTAVQRRPRGCTTQRSPLQPMRRGHGRSVLASDCPSPSLLLLIIADSWIQISINQVNKQVNEYKLSRKNEHGALYDREVRSHNRLHQQPPETRPSEH